MCVAIIAVTGLILATLALLVLVSYGVEALRRPPQAPARLDWAPEIKIETLDLGGVAVRYLRTGTGPNLVLLHTLRTQLDIFQKILPELAEHFTVYAYDYPGHGWSDIPPADYAPEDFYRWTEAFLERLDLKDATLAGISIGGTIALTLAARDNPRIARVIAINPYDYWPSGSIRKSSLMARLILMPAEVPILGATLMRLRNGFVTDAIMRGGVARGDALPPRLKAELYDTGERKGQYQGFLRLLAHEALWAEAPKDYRRIKVPVLLVYGVEDWAPQAARARNRAAIPQVLAREIAGGSHFLSLDCPYELLALILQFASEPAASKSAIAVPHERGA